MVPRPEEIRGLSKLLQSDDEDDIKKSKDESDSFSFSFPVNLSTGSISETFNSWVSDVEGKIGLWLFPNLPESYSLRKKLAVTKTTTNGWAIYDSVQIALIVVYTALFLCISFQSDLDYEIIQNLYRADIAITQIFVLDFLLFFYMHPSTTMSYLLNGNTIISIASLIPTYMGLVDRSNDRSLSMMLVTINFLKCTRVLLILKITKGMRYINNLSGLRRQVVYLTLSVSIMIILATGLVYLTENMVEGCRYINAATNWEPSCSEYEPSSSNCDCDLYDCGPYYSYGDKKGQPSYLMCKRMSRLDSFYYIIVTVATIGYGDVKVTSPIARAVSIIFIGISVVLIPMKLSELQNILSLSNPYSKPFVRQANEGHVIITGFTSDKRKLENFLSEFFHPDRAAQEAEEYHAVILSPNTPSEDIRSLLQSHALESKVTWVLGSPGSIASLKKAQAESALAMFFLIDSDLIEGQTRSEDAANVLSALSVSNFNSAIVSFVQVIRPENGDILQDSDVDMILCLDEYKSAIQARNSVCPGFTTFIENIFHSMGALDSDVEKTMAPWYDEYLHGAGIEIYFVKLNRTFIRAMRYNYLRMVDLVYIKWGCTVLGLCGDDRKEAIFNPTAKDVRGFASVKALFESFDVLIIMADDSHIAEDIQFSLESDHKLYDFISDAVDEEEHFPCGSGQQRTLEKLRKNMGDSSSSGIIGTLSGAAAMARGRTMSNLSVYVDNDDSDSEISQEDAANLPVKTKQQLGSGVIASPSSIINLPSDSDSDSDSKNSSEGNDLFTDESDDDDAEDEEALNYVGYTDKTLAKSFAKQRFLSNASKSNNQLSNPTKTQPKASSDSDNDDEVDRDEEGEVEDEDDDSDYYDSDSDEDDDDYREDDDEAGLRLDLLRATEENSYGRPSRIVKDAMNLSDHIIVHGGENQIVIFVEELRKPLINGDIYHPIVIVYDKIPRSWPHIAELYNDVYLLVGKITSSSVLKRLNFKFAFSLALMAQRTTMTKVDEINVNIGTLFTYLKLERYIPRSLHATVELTSPSNMGVLNATIMRRFQDSLQKQMLPIVSELQKGSPQQGKPTQNDAKMMLAAITEGSAPETPPTSDLTPSRRTVVLNQSQARQQREATASKNQMAKPQRRAAITEGNGRFATKRNTKVILPGQSQPASGALMPPAPVNSLMDKEIPVIKKSAPRRGSTLGLVTDAAAAAITNAASNFAEEVKQVEVIGNMLDTMNASDWDAMETHYVLPVFASAKAFVPSSFESLIVQSFYEKLTPVICDKFVCGQKAQSMRSVKIPPNMTRRKYIDLFRLFCANNVLCVAIYRAPQKNLNSVLPYVVTNPPPDMVLSPADLAIVFADSTSLIRLKIAARQIR